MSSLVVDGRVINMSNSWRGSTFSSGDDLMYYLEDLPTVDYTLSHHPKSMKTQTFGDLRKWELPLNMVDGNKVCDDSVSALHRLYDIIFEVATRVPTARMGGENAMLFRLGADRAERGNLLVPGGYGRPPPADAAARAATARAANRRQWANTGDVHLLPEEARRALSKAMRNVSDPLELLNFVKNVEMAGPASSVSRLTETIERLAGYLESRRGDHRKSPLLSTRQGRVVAVNESVFQLVPGVSSSCENGVREAVWRHGYWHIARSQVCACLPDEGPNRFTDRR